MNHISSKQLHELNRTIFYNNIEDSWIIWRNNIIRELIARGCKPYLHTYNCGRCML